MAIYDFADEVRQDTGQHRALLVEEDFSWSDAPERPLKGKFGEVTARRGKVPAERIIRSSSTRLDGAVRRRAARATRDEEAIGIDRPAAYPHGARVDHVDGGNTMHERGIEDRRRNARPAADDLVERRDRDDRDERRDRQEIGHSVVLRRAADLDPYEEFDEETRVGLLSRFDITGRQLERYALWTFLLVLALFLGTAGTGHAAALSHIIH